MPRNSSDSVEASAVKPLPRTVPAGSHVILLLGQLCFASLPVAGRMAMIGHLPPGLIVLARMTGGALVFSLLAARRGTLHIARRDLLAVVGCAVIGVAANQELFIQGLARTTATNATVLSSTSPVFTALVAIVTGREPPRARRLLGIAIAFGGAIALVGIDRMSIARGDLTGCVFVLLNSLCYGTYLVLGRPLAERYDPVALLAVMFIAGVPMVAPFAIAAIPDAPPLTLDALAYFAFLIAIPTVAAYGLVQTALRRADATLVAAYVYLQPVFATAGAMLLLHEQPTVRLAVCGAVVLGGVWLAARSRA
jgi:drug/metabolite transporter (DMT)-like permease